ncbi:MAG: ABC transporter permease [Hyphomicrobiaceae bacterium]
MSGEEEIANAANAATAGGGWLPPDGAALPHYVNPAPFDAMAAETLSQAQERVWLASQWQLIWWKFRRHRLAVVSAVFLGLVYLVALFAEWFAPYNYQSRHVDHIHAPPQAIHLFHNGEFVGPFVYGYDYRLDMETMHRVYTINREKVQPLRFFCRADRYQFWGLVEARFHLFCPAIGGHAFLLGTDELGHDLLSRIVEGARVSMTIGLLGVLTSIVLGVVLGGLAGYYGGIFDTVLQRIMEVLQSLPTIPLWLAIAAIIPINWSPLAVYLMITVILGFVEWTGLARAVRSKLLSLREEDYILAAELNGAGTARIVGMHLVPGFASHLIAAASLSIPTMILGETALSFLGLGLRPPVTSWGVLLTEAQNINVVALYPWLILPVVPVILVVLAFNFLGDGLRDAADPYR